MSDADPILVDVKYSRSGSIEFSHGTINSDNTLSVVRVKTLKRSSINKCPHFIMAPEHYRDDESCRCNDPDHVEMSEWGYTWDDNTWIEKEE